MLRICLISIVGSILVACGYGLGQQISLAIVERTAKATTTYCYIKDSGEEFCMLYKGVRQ